VKKEDCGKAIIIEEKTLSRKPRKSQEVDIESTYSSALHPAKNRAQRVRHNDALRRVSEGQKANHDQNIS
jgi:hypothetical protein